MARFLPWLGVVRDFIGREPGLLGELLREVIEIGGAVVCGRHQPPALIKIEISRAGLDRELVERHVALLLGQRTGEFGAPLLRRLVRTRIDHVEGDAREDFRRQPEGSDGFFRGMLAAQRLQVLVVQRLHAD